MSPGNYVQAGTTLAFGACWQAAIGAKPVEPWAPLTGFAIAFILMGALTWLWGKRRALFRYRISIQIRRTP